MAGGGRLAIHCDSSDHQSRDDVVSLVLAKNNNASADRGNGNVIHSGYPQLPATGQMNRERHKWSCMNQLAHLSYHSSIPITLLDEGEQAASGHSTHAVAIKTGIGVFKTRLQCEGSH
jgi:hypothetical protein